MKNLALSLTTLLFSTNVFSSTITNKYGINTSIGLLNGGATELVYDEVSGEKISQLDWKIKNTPILKIGAYVDFKHVTLNGNFWTLFSDSDAYMKDRDWFDPEQPSYTDISTHNNTDLVKAMGFDFNLTYWFKVEQNYKIGVLGGYQHSNFKWDSYGGEYSYNNGNDSGVFPDNEIGISYEQKFNTPYVGLNGIYKNNSFELSALLKFSMWVKSEDIDNHHARDLTFYEKGEHSKYYALEMMAAYYVYPSVKLFAEFSVNKYLEADASMKIVDNATGDSVSFGKGSAGLDNTNSMFLIGINYSF